MPKYITYRRRFERIWNGEWISKSDEEYRTMYVCQEGLDEWFEVPEGLQEFDLTVSTNPGEGYKLEPRYMDHDEDVNGFSGWYALSPSEAEAVMLDLTCDHWLRWIHNKHPQTQFYISMEYLE